MPNWCFTKITINHWDQRGLERLDALLDEWTSKDYKENGFGLEWLGNIVGNSGIGTITEEGKATYSCRGRMTYKDLADNQLLIDTETAWSPMLKMWIALVERYLPDAEIIYTADECGCGLYCTNDPTLENCYIIDSWDIDEVESDWEASEKTVIKTLQKLLNSKKRKIDALLKEFEDSEYSDGMSINKWDFEPITVWE